MKKIFITLLLFLFVHLSQAVTRFYKGVEIAEISVVEYYAGYKEYWVNNDLPKSYRNYKILILGFDDQILSQEELGHTKAGNFFTLYFTNPNGVIRKSNIFSLRIVIVEKTFWEKLLGAVPPIRIRDQKKYFSGLAISTKNVNGFFIEVKSKI